MAGSALLDARAILSLAQVRPGMTIADFGVGRTGHLIFPAAQMVGEEGRVYGVDLMKDALRMLEGRRRQYLVHNLDLVHGDIEAGNLPIAEKSLDRVFLVHTLPVMQQHVAVAREIRRLLKNDGVAIVIDWRLQTQHPVAPAAQFRLSPQAVDLAFAKAGCEVCHEFAPSPWHWGRMYR